jgi:hypothetical protein
VHADLVDPLGLGMGELLVTVDAEAEENSIPTQVREKLELVQLDAARGVPQLEIYILAIALDALGKELILGWLPGRGEGILVEAAVIE